MQQQLRIVGVDVAKAKLVVAGLQQPAQVVLNCAPAITVWLRGLPVGTVVAMEATGAHHRLLAQMAHAAGMRVLVLNARDVFFYAKALSGRGKTDRLDAALIARFAAEHNARLHAWRPATGVQQQVQDLLRRRAQVTRLRVALRQTLSDVAQLQEAGQRLCEHFEVLLQEIDRQLLAALDSDPQLQRGVALLRTITGFGPQASVLVAALLSRVRFDNADALVAYSGLDPRPQDSGTKHGKRRLSKRGPAQLRRQLYLAAFGASHSHALGAVYRALKAKGFAPTQALVILARKLLRVAWAVWHSGQPFDAARLTPMHG